MGAEAKCTVRIKGKSASGTARLETEVVQFRGRSTGSRSARASSRAGGDLKLSIPFKTMTRVVAKDGKLTIATADGDASFDLGDAAAKWADKILHPPSRLDKIGVKSEWRASAIGVDDETFLTELARAVAVLSIGRVQSDSDAIFYGVTKDAQLARLEKLKAKIKPNGAIWVIRPKGRPEISERAVMAAGKGAGLVDVKVVGFSATHTAEKFVIPVAKR
jgi:hypothetical protein